MEAYRIEVTRNWHFERFKFLTPGTYMVPQNVSFAEAERAIAAQAAKRIDPEPKKLVVEKMPAPEKKVLDAAPENKAGPTGAEKPLSSRQAARRKPKKT